MKNNMEQNKSQKVPNHFRGEFTNNTNLGLVGQIDRTMVDLGKSIDHTTFRILLFLFEENGHTKAQIAEKLKLWEKLIDEKLKWLIKKYLIHDKRMTFGIDISGGRRKIRVYYITELGRFLLHHLDMQFPGFCMTTSEMEAENCEYNK